MTDAQQAARSRMMAAMQEDAAAARRALVQPSREAERAVRATWAKVKVTQAEFQKEMAA
ncbi:hypothetical protein [Sphingobium sp. CCH11-B1]|uniref:hypothetical protein n=1 Tax=Sphingobium sp. CCH11-B1 TaxID=1768781 RepID=UPI000AAF3DC4|nr:hypothetical protein [Sphingobium sp. CCH11-B1]